MTSSLESKALALAILAASISLGGALLMAIPIKHFAAGGMGPRHDDAAMPEIVASADPTLIAQGRSNFVMSCAECHNDDATGDEGPNLHNLTISNARIATTIKHGVKGEMPSFAKKYDDAQVATILAYLRSLQ